MESQYKRKNLHDGEMLRRSIEKSPLTLSGVARKMDIAHSTLLSFYKRPNLRTSVLWQASQILECNLFFDIGKEMFDDTAALTNKELTHRIAELERENEHLRIENETYLKILKR